MIRLSGSTSQNGRKVSGEKASRITSKIRLSQRDDRIRDPDGGDGASAAAGVSRRGSGYYAAMQANTTSPHRQRGGMRRILIRGGIAVVLLPALWYFASRWCALAVDQVYTPRLASLEAAPIGWNGTWLQIGIGFFDKGVPDGYRADFT